MEVQYEPLTLPELFQKAKKEAYQELDRQKTKEKTTRPENAHTNIPDCLSYILTAKPKTDNTNFNKLILNLVTGFQRAGYDYQATLNNALPFLTEYPHSTAYPTPKDRIEHFRTQWGYVEKNQNYDFSCSYILGLKFPGSAFDCKKCDWFEEKKLDDSATIEEMIQGATLETLPKVIKRLANLNEIEKAVYIGALSKKMDIPKRAIQKDLKKDETKRANSTEILTTAYFPELVDLCIDKDGSVAFLINKNEILEVSPIYEIDGSLYKPPDKGKIPFLLPRAESVCSWAKKDTGENLFNDLFNQLKRYSFIPDHQFVIADCFVFLTYLQDHPEIQYFPMLLFWSSPERGKSRTGKAVAYCSFRGLHIVDMREANLFRYSQNFHSTLFIDMMDLWKKAERNQSEDILLLRFERGAKVARVLYPEKGAFQDMVYFDVYGPTVMASNEAVHHILDTRCLPISMPNKPEDYENPTPEKLLEIKERLTAWRAGVMGQPLPEVDVIPGIGGRLWDISKPLFQVCQMVSPAHLDTLKGAILEIAGQRREEKQETIVGQIVSIIYNLSPKELPEWTVSVEKILDRVNEKRAEGHKVTSQYLGKKLRAIGFNTRKVHGYAEVKLTKGYFDIFLNQYGLAAKNTDGEYQKETLPNSTTLKNSMISETYPGRELGENGGECQETLPKLYQKECEQNQQVLHLVESGRVSTHTGHRKDLNKGEGEMIDLTGVEVEIQP
jgi:hypothetical protein